MRKNTKEKIRKAFKIILSKGFIFSYNELYREGMEYRAINSYISPYCNISEQINYFWWNKRKNFVLKDKTKKILNTTIGEAILFENPEVLKFLKLLFY